MEDSKRRSGELELQLEVAERELRKARAQADEIRVDLVRVQSEETVDEGRLAVLPSKAAALPQRGYVKELGHLRFVYPTLAFLGDTFCLDHEIVGGRLVRHHADGVGFDVLHP